jgi:hypothetical protein
MSRIKSLSLLVVLLGGATAFTSSPQPSASTDSTVGGMCLRYYCYYNGQCNYNPTCWSRGCRNCIQ